MKLTNAWFFRSMISSLLWFFFAVSSSFAQLSLWQTSNLISNSDLVPTAVSYARGISIETSAIDSLAVGNTITVELLPGQYLDFELRSSRNYINGDVGWSAFSSDNSPASLLTLIVNSESVAGKIKIVGSSFSVRTILDSENTGGYAGVLYSQDNVGTILPTDDGGVIPQILFYGDEARDEAEDEPAPVLAISANDVTIKQELSSDLGAIGDIVDIVITLTNNTASTLTNEFLNVLFTLEVSELTSSSARCAPDLVAQLSLRCSLPDIAPGENTEISYSIRLTEDSYPQINNAAFVGDLSTSEVIRNDAFITVSQDTLLDTDGDGDADFNELIAGTDPISAASSIPSDTVSEIDLMFLYTQRFVDDIGNISPETKINELVQATNSYYANSRVNVAFRPVIYRMIDYSVVDLNSAFNDVEFLNSPFEFVEGMRSVVGADVTILIDGLFPGSNSFCGLGTTPGIGFNGELFHPTLTNSELIVTMYTDGFPEQGESGCYDDTLAHELGHNLGLNHSHRQPDAQGTFPWSVGHGVDGSFTTLMAHPADFPGSQSVPFFSSPESTDCNGMPCGVSRLDTEQGADAVFSLNHTRFQVSDIRQPRLLPVTSISGSSNLTMYGAATLSSTPDVPQSSFSSTDALDVRATLGIPSEHQGVTGETYVVISVDGTGLFFRDANGSYQGWDGDLATLQPNITARPLNVTEELVAFENFIPSTVGVSAANLTVFFAYAIPNTDTFVYSSSGIPVSIQP